MGDDDTSGSSGAIAQSTGPGDEAPAGDTTADGSDGSDTGFTPGGECGNGVIDLGEECDDAGDGDNDDGCTDICTLPRCGDTYVQASRFEHCDAGPEGSAECTPGCTAVQAPRWTYVNDSEIGDSEIIDVAIDTGGNVIAVGSIGTTAAGTDIWIAKLGPDGREIWARTFSGDTFNGYDSANGVALAANDDIVVGGSVQISGQSYDAWIGRIDPAGEPQWITVEDIDGEGALDSLDAVALGSDESVFFTGVRQSAAGVALWYGAYSSAGIRTWDASVDGQGFYANGYGVAVNGDAIAVAGTVADDVWVRKADTTGNEQWTVTFHAIADNLDTATGVHIADDGAVYVLGSSDYIYLRKLDPAGGELWSRVYEEGGFSANGMAFTGDAIYIASTDRVFEHGRIASLRKLTLEGDEVWMQLLDEGTSLSGGRDVAARGDSVALSGWVYNGLDGTTGFARLFSAP